MDGLFAAKYSRFQRSRQDLPHLREVLESVFHTKLSGRTERRYRRPTSSQPHVDALIQLTLANVARYSDALRARRSIPSDRGRFSLDTLLHARHLHDLSGSMGHAHLPVPADRWAALRKEYVEWPMLLSMAFPHLRLWDDRVVRLPQGSVIQGLDPSISPGSLILLENVPGTPDLRSDARKTGWSRPIYALRRGAEIFCGHLQREGQEYAVLANVEGNVSPVRLRHDEFRFLSRVAGIAVPV